MATLYLDCDFGSPAYAGLATVGYRVVNASGTVVARTTSGVVDRGGGVYCAAVTVPDGTVGTIVWSTDVTEAVHAAERLDARLEPNALADAVLRRRQDGVEASAYGDAPSLGSLYGSVQAQQRASADATTLTVRKTDGTTLGTLTLASDPDATPVTGVS